MNTVNEDRKYLDLAIESYLNQKGCEVELIISTLEGDPNLQHIKEKYPSCVIVTLPIKGHPIEHGLKNPVGSFMQLNNALPHITGDWFCFASANDVAFINKLELELSRCKETGAEVCYSSFDLVNEQGEKISTQRFHDYYIGKHLKGNFVSDCALISKRLVDKYLPFNLSLNNYAYWDLWLRIYEGEGNVFTYNSTPTWGYRQNSDSMHLSRQKDPIKLKQAKIDKRRMLALHT